MCFIIGEDNLQNFNFWKNWKDILYVSHLLVLSRTCIKKYNPQLKKWIDSHQIKDYRFLYKQSFGYIFFSKTKVINISSSQIRKNYYEKKKSCTLLPLSVQKYIELNKLYYKK